MRTEILPYEKYFCPVAEVSARLEGLKQQAEELRVIIVDCSALDRTGDLMALLEDYPKAVIDHHGKGKFEDQAHSLAGSAEYPCFLDTRAPSTTFMIHKLIMALGLEITREEAEFLFFGLCTDTGFFRHVDSGGAETFDFAAALIRSGASPKAAYAAIHDGKTLNSRKLLGTILARSEPLFDGKLIISSEEYEETCRFGTEGRDSDSMYKLLQAVAGVEAVAIIRQETPERCAVGLRSRSWVDVGDVAKLFGGGGHKNAAGFSADGTISEIKPKILNAFGKIFKNTF
jgi:phosphoesterase RecJ-like protein